MARNELADRVWRQMSTLVLDNKDSWRRNVVERTGLPFSRIRILIRLARRPMTVKQIAEAATIDAPAATVAVNDLEKRGLVVRRIDPANRRCKVVSLTDEGRQVVATIDAVDDPAPDALAQLVDDELELLWGILGKMAGPGATGVHGGQLDPLVHSDSSTAIAALCPPTPETPPPRRAPAPHSKIRS